MRVKHCGDVTAFQAEETGSIPVTRSKHLFYKLKMKKFYIFGLQRSGTSFLENLITSNYEAEIANSEGTWKHMLTTPACLKHPAFYIIKSPYTWVESVVYREAADLPKTSPSILNSGKIMINNINIEELILLYRNHFLVWKDFTSFIKYEDLLIESKQILYTSQFGFMRKTKVWNRVKPGSLFMSEGFKESLIPYYTIQKPTHLSNDIIELINKILEDDFFQLTGYKKCLQQ